MEATILSASVIGLTTIILLPIRSIVKHQKPNFANSYFPQKIFYKLVKRFTFEQLNKSKII